MLSSFMRCTDTSAHDGGRSHFKTALLVAAECVRMVDHSLVNASRNRDRYHLSVPVRQCHYSQKEPKAIMKRTMLMDVIQRESNDDDCVVRKQKWSVRVGCCATRAASTVFTWRSNISGSKAIPHRRIAVRITNNIFQ